MLYWQLHYLIQVQMGHYYLTEFVLDTANCLYTTVWALTTWKCIGHSLPWECQCTCGWTGESSDMMSSMNWALLINYRSLLLLATIFALFADCQMSEISSVKRAWIKFRNVKTWHLYLFEGQTDIMCSHVNVWCFCLSTSILFVWFYCLENIFYNTPLVWSEGPRRLKGGICPSHHFTMARGG